MKRIVFISAHDFRAKRQGGFHVFAELLSRDNDVIFFSYPRSVFIKCRKNKPIEYSNIHYFKTRNELYGRVRNVSRLFYIPPVKLMKILPRCIVDFFHTLTFPSFKSFCTKYFGDVDFFIFESNASVILYKRLKKLYPAAKFLYRPSDPMLNSSDLTFFHKYEKEYVVASDFVFMVNQEGIDLYKKYISNLDPKKYCILSNGIDIDAYNKVYSRPKEYSSYNNIVSYIGARPPQWDLIVYSARKLLFVNFFVICPENPPHSFIKDSKTLANIHYIQGIPPKLVPSFVTNADMIMIPNPTDMYKKYPWGITAKYYQAMYARKRIVAYSDSSMIKDLGIDVVYDYDSFTQSIQNNIGKGEVKYNFDFESKDWKYLASKMQIIIDKL